MNNDGPNFLDGKTLLAIGFVVLTFVGWQFYMQKKYPDAFKKKAETSASPVSGEVNPAGNAQSGETPAENLKAPQAGNVNKKEDAKKGVEEIFESTREEKVIAFENQDLAFDISSRGMGLKNFRVLKYSDREGKVIRLGNPEEQYLPLETRLLGNPNPLDFDLEKVSDLIYVGRAVIGALSVTKTIEVLPLDYAFKVRIETAGSSERFVGLTTVLAEEVDPIVQSNFLMPQFEMQEFYVESSDTTDRVIFTEEDLDKSWSKVRVASVGSQYFTQAIVDKSAIMPEGKAQVNHKGKVASLLLQYPVLTQTDGLKLEYTAYMGPKSHHLLSQVDANLAHVINLGFFNFIARQILAMLNWFYGLVGNWGLAIILLTILVRILVLPFNLYSYKSMKAMQAIQPKLQSLRERFADDKQKQQVETLALMREHKVNPLGGCLPVLLQFPIFIALYQVLGHSIELYQAPFGLWINDLSLKDPYYILPVLMGVTMFVQQKITPNTMDPAQAKVLLFMPLIFTVFMVTLPSGLTLYMWVGAVFSVLQQLYFMRDRTEVVAET